MTYRRRECANLHRFNTREIAYDGSIPSVARKAKQAEKKA